MRFILIFFFIVLAGYSVKAQFALSITQMETTQDVEDLIKNVFLEGVNPAQYKNVTFTGDPKAVGYFTSGYIFGFQRPEGIVMGSGLVQQYAKSNACTANQSTNTGGGSDPDLQQAAGQGIQDACIIEFDFKPSGDSVKFNYVFSSEEYHEWVGTQWNDVFGFFLSGPGISGSYSNNAINIAEVPGTHDPVKISTVNCGNASQNCNVNPSGGTNCEFLVDNLNTDNGGYNTFTLDAYTVPFTADNGVQSCQWYHIKLAIGDASDANYDSGVFLEKGSFDPGNVEKQTTYTHPTVDSLLYESCNNYESVIYFKIGSLRSDPYKIPFTVQGTAERDVDYSIFTTHPGDSVIIEEGSLYDSIRIRTYADSEVEGVEDVQIIFNAVMCGFGAPDTAFVKISDLPPMPDTALTFYATCEETITLDFGLNIGGVSPYTFDWYTLHKDTETVEFTPSGKNYYTIPCQIYDTCGQQVSDTAIVIVPALVADAGPDKSMCNVPEVQLEGSAPGASTHLWSSQPNDPTLAGQESDLQPLVSPVVNTEYILAINDNCKNDDQDTVNVSLNEAVADAGPDQSICKTFSVDLAANGTTGFSWEWSASPNDPSLTGQENNQNITVSPTTTTTYSVIVTNDCDFSATATVEVTVNDLPSADAGTNQEVCLGQDIQLEASGGMKYQWTSVPNDPSLSVGGQDTLANPMVTPPTQEPYKYYVQVWNQFQCTSVDSMEVEVLPVPDVSASTPKDFLCLGEETTISAVGTANDFVWTSVPFDPDLAAQQGNATITVSPDTTTVYTLEGRINGNICPKYVDQVITVKPEVIADFGVQDDITCQGSTFSIMYTGNAGSAATYDWDYGDATWITGSDQGPIDLSWGSQGTKTITLSVTEDGCPSVPVSKTVAVSPTPVTAFDADLFEDCAPLIVNFTNNSDSLSSNVTYLWSFGNGEESNDVNPSYTYDSPGSYDVTLTVTNDSRCASTITELSYINVNEVPTAGFTFFPEEVVLEAATIDFTDASNSQDVLTWEWDFGDGNTSDKENPSHTYTTSGEFDVLLLVTTANGCEDTIQKTVTVHPDFAVYAPNAFTPNGDGLNDFFQVKGLGIKTYLLQIYSRWGDLIYESNNLEDQWDGKFNGEFVETGTYAYTIKYESMLNKNYSLEGTVTVMR